MKQLKKVMFGFFCFSFMTTAIADDFDIVGLKLGMSFDEVQQTLLTHGAKPKVSSSNINIFSTTTEQRSIKQSPSCIA